MLDRDIRAFLPVAHGICEKPKIGWALLLSFRDGPLHIFFRNQYLPMLCPMRDL